MNTLFERIHEMKFGYDYINANPRWIGLLSLDTAILSASLVWC